VAPGGLGRVVGDPVRLRQPIDGGACDPAGGSGPRRRWARRLAIAAGALLVLVLLAGAWARHGTRYETQALRQLPAVRERGAPAWSRPCWRPNRPPYHGWYTFACARVDGRVVYRQRHDPDGDADAHLLVIAGTHVVNLKFRNAAGAQGLPGVGRRVVVVGLLSSGRMHVPEVDVRRIG
jgi:hypothetical protein